MMKKTLQPFAKNIRTLRRKKGISQDMLAKKSNVSSITISKIESGDNPNPTMKTLQNVAKVLGVSVVDLIQ